LIAQLRTEGASSSQKAYDEAENRRGVGDNENAYLLYFFAARHGHGDAALALGTMADPAYYSSVSSALTAPDSAQAVKWYKKAIDAGNGDAKKRLADLTRRIKKQAENGSSEAQRLLLQLL
jgi:TPR repeat protein